jgi:hypothetical protein
LKNSFSRQLSISAVVLVLILLPLLYAGHFDNEVAASYPQNSDIGRDADYTITDVVSTLDLYSPEDFAKRVIVSDSQDIGLALYEDQEYRERIILYYEAITGSREIAETVLRNASVNHIPFSLAFSLMWAESRFNPDAFNRNASSIDRGLYQLNSESFPDLSLNQFYDIETNVSTGLSYLRYCLDLGKNEIVALAIYNAGHGRVSGAGAPLMTLDHVSNIMDYKSELERDFERYISQKGKIRTDKKSDKNLIPVVDTRKSLK